MPRRKSLSDIGVAALKPRAARYAEPDPELRGHYVRVHPSGSKSFVAVARDPAGKQVWATIGATDLLDVDDARIRARSAIERIRKGLRAFEAPPTAPDTFEAVTRIWIKRHVEPSGLRSRREIERLLARHVLPAWGEREFLSIRRSDVAALLDGIEDDHGSRQADVVVTIVRSMMNWFATRHDDYTPPIVRGMRRQDPKAQARSRILDDAEICALWHVAELSGTFGAILKTCLLTAQRSRKVGRMKWGDLVDGEWSIPRESREKETGGTLLLSKAVLDIIRSQPRIGSNPHVFAGRGDRPFTGWDRGKQAVDAKLSDDMPRWTVHDLRRTARSLMSRAGVQSDVAEMVLGHALVGVRSIYDRHFYRDEKADALKRLAALVETIINPPASNVVPLHEATRAINIEEHLVRKLEYLEHELEYLENYRAMWEAGMWPALSEAISYCEVVRIPLPEWASHAVLKIMQDHYLVATASTRTGGAHASPKGRLRADYAHYLRWLAVKVVLTAHNLTDLPGKKGRPPPRTATKAGLLAEAPDILRRLKKEELARLGTIGVADKLEKSFRKVERSRANGEAQFKFDDLATFGIAEIAELTPPLKFFFGGEHRLSWIPSGLI